MKKKKGKLGYFTIGEIILWSFSISFILLSFFVFDRKSYAKLGLSLLGATSLIFCAKGNPIGQMLMVLFGSCYGLISFGFGYYGEMITYLGMSVPMAIFALISWLKNPYKGNRAQVKINRLKAKEIIFLFSLAALITFVFYFILKAFGTQNLIPSTVSVATSFIAVYLTARRSPFYALAYSVNDIVLIVLWVLACIRDISYVSVVTCFIVFLANDTYGFFNWRRMQKKQESI